MKVEGFRRSLAFLVAVDRYTSGVPPLRTPIADARALAEHLQEDHGFEVDVIADEEATLAGLRAFLAGLPGRVGADDRVAFYFAGHGVPMDGDDGPQGYVLPQDADRGSAASFLPMAELSRALEALPCRHLLAILDCCFAGAFRWSSGPNLAIVPDELHQERYAWFVRDPAWQAIASAAYDQKALDVAAGESLGVRGDAVGHSPFARALLDGLAGAADRRRADGDDGDGVITATELYLHLRERLEPTPGSPRWRQTPSLWPLPKHDKGEFVFLAPGRAPDLPPAPSLDEAANPWRGLKPYESVHAELFFGRKRVSEDLLARVSVEPFVVVTGPSGIEKSSLVRAGLLAPSRPQPPARRRPPWVDPVREPRVRLAGNGPG